MIASGTKNRTTDHFTTHICTGKDEIIEITPDKIGTVAFQNIFLAFI